MAERETTSASDASTRPYRPSSEAVRTAQEWVAEWDSLTDAERAERNEALANAIREADDAPTTSDPSVTRALRALDGAIAEIETANGDCTASAYGSLLAARDLLTDGYEPAEGGADPDMVALNTQHLFDRDASDPVRPCAASHPQRDCERFGCAPYGIYAPADNDPSVPAMRLYDVDECDGCGKLVTAEHRCPPAHDPSAPHE